MIVARRTVYLEKIRIKTPKKVYEYWMLRWWGTDGKEHGTSIGRTNKMSRRQAEKVRQEKQLEFANHPSRRSVKRAPYLEDYLDSYYQARQSELAPGTLELHKLTGRYLVGFFGKSQRIDKITRSMARAFKTALAAGKLARVNKVRKVFAKNMAASTVELNVRNACTMLKLAVEDDLIPFNPFDRLAKTVKVQKKWHYVTPDEFRRLADHAIPRLRWLISLCRLAGLRLGEASALEWVDIDWERSRLTIIARQDWQPKDKDPRVIPICPELQAILLEAYESADDGRQLVIPKTNQNNLWRDMQVLCKRATVQPYSKPLHTLRKSCLTDWAGRFPQHVVSEWGGHSDIQTTNEYYLQVPASEYDRCAQTSFFQKPQKSYQKNAISPKTHRQIEELNSR